MSICDYVLSGSNGAIRREERSAINCQTGCLQFYEHKVFTVTAGSSSRYDVLSRQETLQGALESTAEACLFDGAAC